MSIQDKYAHYKLSATQCVSRQVHSCAPSVALIGEVRSSIRVLLSLDTQRYYTLCLLFFFFMIRRPPRYTLFPYTTLFLFLKEHTPHLHSHCYLPRRLPL